MESFGDFWWFGEGWEWTRGNDLQTTFLSVWIEGLSWWDCVLRALWGQGSFVLYVSNLVILEHVGCWWEWSYRKGRGWFCGWRTARWRNEVPERERGNRIPSHSTKRLWCCLYRRELTKDSHSYRQVGDLVAKRCWKPCLLASVVPEAIQRQGWSISNLRRGSRSIHLKSRSSRFGTVQMAVYIFPARAMHNSWFNVWVTNRPSWCLALMKELFWQESLFPSLGTKITQQNLNCRFLAMIKAFKFLFTRHINTHIIYIILTEYSRLDGRHRDKQNSMQSGKVRSPGAGGVNVRRLDNKKETQHIYL